MHMRRETVFVLFLIFMNSVKAKAQSVYGCFQYKLSYTQIITYNGGHCGHIETSTLSFKGGGIYETAQACSNSLNSALDRVGSNECATTSVNIEIGCECIPFPKSKQGNAPSSIGNQQSNISSNSKPKTTSNTLEGKEITDPEKKINIDSYSGLCSSQIGNINKIKEAQNSLGKGDAASYSVLNSAINQMKNVECGIVLKSVVCKNNNCNFEWSTKDSKLTENQAQASVDRFKKELAKEEQTKAEANKTKVELVQLGVEALFAIADAIDRHYQEKQSNKQSSERFTKVDEDNDGNTETLVEDAANGGQNLYMDTNGDGMADKLARIDKSGKPTYENIPPSQQFSMQSSTNPNSNNFEESLISDNALPKTWEDFYKTQPAKPGEDGYMTIVKPKGEISVPYDYQSPKKNYFINGIDNQYHEAMASAELLANTVNEPVVQFYDATDGKIIDMVDAYGTRLGFSESQASNNLGLSLTYDLLADKEVTLYAHSKGAALSYYLVQDISAVFQSSGVGDKLQNLTIVTVGGFAPSVDQWPKGVNVIPLKHPNDPVPPLGGNGTITEMPNLAFHSFESYLNEIVTYNFNKKKGKK